MGEVIEIDTRRVPSFFLKAELPDDSKWEVTVDYYDKAVDQNLSYREIAAALIPIAGGLVAAAEGNDPSRRGMMLANLSLFEDGTVDIHMPELDAELKRWILQTIDRAREKIAAMPVRLKVRIDT